MRHLLFVRHSLPLIEESIERRYWRLSEEGVRRAEQLAARVAAYDVQAVVTSNEMKAIETANAVAAHVHRPFEIDERLAEHSINAEPFFTEPAFKRMVDNFFEKPDEVVFGEESANAAAKRLATAVSSLRRKYRTGDVVIVSHGRVLSTYLAPHLQTDPFELWKQLKTPGLVVLEIPKMKPIEVVYSVDQL